MQKKIPLNLIIQAQKHNMLDTLAYWMRLRGIGIVYNYNSRNIAAILNISPTTAAKQVKKMLSIGVVHFSGKNLIFTGVKKLILKFGKRVVWIKLFKNKRIQKLALLAQLLGDNLHKQKKKVREKLNILKKLRTYKLTSRDNRIISKNGGLEAFQKTFKPFCFLSNKKIGRTLNLSRRTASKYQCLMSEAGIINKSPHFELISKCDYETFVRAKCEKRSLVYFKGHLYQQRPNKITLVKYLPLASVGRTKVDKP